MTAGDPGTADSQTQAQPERTLSGLAVSPGFAIGPAYIVDQGVIQVPEFSILPQEIDNEIARFRKALATSRKQIAKLKSKAQNLPSAAAEEMDVLLEAHQQMVTTSRLVRGVEDRIRDGQQNAASAVQTEIGEVLRGFQGMADSYLAARAADIRDVGNRIIRNLLERRYVAFTGLTEGSIILAEELTPADTALMDPNHIGGFAAVLGGVEGHSGIMARSLGLPAVLGVPNLLGDVRNGETVVLDGHRGKVILSPEAETLEFYRDERRSFVQERERLKQLTHLPSVTRDNHPVNLEANVELTHEVTAALENGAAGIGLFRTEFIYMNRDDLPTEDEQCEQLRYIVELMAGRPVTVRTLDIGGEKVATNVTERAEEGPNPALGLRAIRLGLREPKLLETQLAAMVRAGQYGPVRILLPMISSAAEVRRVREVLTRVVRRLKRRGVRLPRGVPPVGVMIEIPGAALAADGLADVADFFAIGTNDLTQYTLAIDRGDEQVADLYDPLHPAVLRLIQFATEAARRAEIPVSVCGEMAGEPRLTPLFLGLGISDLSMSPAALPDVKRRLRELDAGQARQAVLEVMEQKDSRKVWEILDRRAVPAEPDAGEAVEPRP